MAPNTIGRFKIGKQLGSGNQGTVYLCTDPELQRRVAIKILDRSVQGTSYRSEARTMSKLQHPNIVSIYEAGEFNGTPYLVFEYVEGRLLVDAIRQDKLDLQQVLEVFKGLLEGVSQAHRAGIVHRDLKPANIILNAEQIPKIMDFGIARLLSGAKAHDEQLIGTPRYLAPEYIRDGEVGPQNDVFALGLILDEMLTGMPVFSGRSQQMVLDNILKVTPEPPSRYNDAVDERLDRFVLKALAKDPALRYSDATEMLAAFHAMRKTRADEALTQDSSHGTVEFLLRRMQRKSDFPALSQSVRSINAMAQARDKDIVQLAGVIVKDFALTNKILKVVNSAYYGSFSGKIGTVSRAVVVLGIQAIRTLAASLIFFEHIQNKDQAAQLKELVSSAMFSASLSAQVAKQLDDTEVEDYFLSALLRDLGKILVTFYLPEEAKEVEHLITQEKLEAQRAQHKVLGVSYEVIGVEIAKQWNFPSTLTESMHHWEAGEKALSRNDRRRMVAEFSKDAMQLMVAKGLDDTAAVTALLKNYEDVLGLDDKQFKQLTGKALDEFKDVAKVLTSDIPESFVRKISGHGETKTRATAASKEVTKGMLSDGLAETQLLNEETVTMTMTMTRDDLVTTDSQRRSEDAEALLMDGLQEVTGLLMEERSVSEVFNVVLETMYRAMGFQRVVLALLNRKTHEMAGRIGFGHDTEEFVKHFRFPSQYRVDVFHGALKNAVDVYITNTRDKKIQGDIPDWYKQISKAGSFLLFPLVVNKRPVGLIYADHARPNGLDIDKKKLNLLKSLRNQIVLAVRP
jgi:serine/threonine protein kinase